MSENKKVYYIPARLQRETIPVVIYCRVSTASKEQLNSLFTQVFAMTRYVASFDDWKLDTKTVGSSLMISIIESIAQAENESRSVHIKLGLEFRAKSGTSRQVIHCL